MHVPPKSFDFLFVKVAFVAVFCGWMPLALSTFILVLRFHSVCTSHVSYQHFWLNAMGNSFFLLCAFALRMSFKVSCAICGGFRILETVDLASKCHDFLKNQTVHSLPCCRWMSLNILQFSSPASTA